MGTTRLELRRKVLLGVKDLTGEDILIADEAINQACSSIAKVQDFEELVVFNNMGATVDGKRTYTFTTLTLTRCKDIYSILAHDDYNSQKLVYKTPQWMDTNYPYPEGEPEDIPSLYTIRGVTVELMPIPDAAYPLYIRHSMWPLTLTADTDECSYTNLDGEIIALARDIFLAYRSGLPIDSVSRAKGYLQLAVKDDRSNPDALPVARGFSTYRVAQAQGTTLTLDGTTWNISMVDGGR